MAWVATLPPDPIVASWWAANDARAAREAAAADARRAAEQDKRQRQLRRKIEKVDEQILLALSASDARRTLRRHGIPYESRSARPEEVEHFTRTGRILSVR